jgi:protein TonB
MRVNQHSAGTFAASWCQRWQEVAHAASPSCRVGFDSGPRDRAKTFVVVAQLLAVGPLPDPRTPLAFDDVRLIQLRDVELPAPPRRSAATTVANGSPDAAPLVAPNNIAAETGLENVHASGQAVEAVDAAIGLPGGSGDAVIGERAAVPPPPPLPAEPVRLRRGMEAPRKIVGADPVYPPVARSARIEGIVVLEAVLDTTGHVESVRVLRSIPLLDQAAVDAVRQWQFTPTMLNGTAVPIVMTVTVDFRLR